MSSLTPLQKKKIKDLISVVAELYAEGQPQAEIEALAREELESIGLGPSRVEEWIKTISERYKPKKKRARKPRHEQTTISPHEEHGKAVQPYERPYEHPYEKPYEPPYERPYEHEKTIKTPGFPWKGIWTLPILATAGFIISAILGSMWFVFAFISLGVSVTIPKPLSLKSVAEEIERIKKFYQRRIEHVERRPGNEEKKARIIAALVERMEAEIKIENILGEIKFEKLRDPRHAYGAGLLKEFFKGLALLLFSIGFVVSNIPLAPMVGIIVGFAGYFYLGGSDYHREEKDK